MISLKRGILKRNMLFVSSFCFRPSNSLFVVFSFLGRLNNKVDHLSHCHRRILSFLCVYEKFTICWKLTLAHEPTRKDYSPDIPSCPSWWHMPSLAQTNNPTPLFLSPAIENIIDSATFIVDPSLHTFDDSLTPEVVLPGHFASMCPSSPISVLILRQCSGLSIALFSPVMSG